MNLQLEAQVLEMVGGPPGAPLDMFIGVPSVDMKCDGLTVAVNTAIGRLAVR